MHGELFISEGWNIDDCLEHIGGSLCTLIPLANCWVHVVHTTQLKAIPTAIER